MDALAIFRIVATEFADIPDDDVTDPDTEKVTYGLRTYLELYSDQISEKRFGKSYSKALAYLTAHKLKMSGYGDNSSGVGKIADSLRVGSVSEGETSVSFTTGQQTNLQVDAEYALTVYGLEFLTLRRNAIIPIINAGEGPCL